MAIVKSGIAKGFSGTLGDHVFSQQPDGTTTVRSVSQASDKPLTVAQLAVCQRTIVCNQFMGPLKEFAKVGFELEAKSRKSNAYNAMTSHVRNNAFTGEYPEIAIDFSKVLITKGKMPPPQDAVVSLTESGLAFSWDPEIKVDGSHFSDQVVMMAYFPKLGQARFIAGGAQRYTGKDQLMLSGIKQGSAVEIYIAFIADNRQGISDSVYLGQLTW